MKTIILGGGLAGLSLAHFLKANSVILEKENEVGGLCRSFNFNGACYDVGPHIIFSKNKDILDFHCSLVETNKFRRSNKIFMDGRFIKYPFENDLFSLSERDKEYCLKEFVNNPYAHYDAKNMLQFFLKNFGEGITRLYLQPYNEKIWKYDPAFMDTQMVKRIPKPPREDVIKSANGITTEGYLHQLHFNYPKEGGIKSLISAYKELAQKKSEVLTDVRIEKIWKEKDEWIIKSNKGDFKSGRLVNCMPLQELFKYLDSPEEVKKRLTSLKYNSIYIAAVIVKEDFLGDNFSITLPDKEVIFHRISKLNFLGENYSAPGTSTLLVEVTFREGSYLESLDEEKIKNKILDDLRRIEFIKENEVIGVELRKFKYAYVIYDLDHRENVDFILNYLKKLGIYCCGRFAEFEYLNMDHVAERSKKLAETLNKMDGE